MYKNTRTAEILVNGDWVKIDPINIKKGMRFRMFEDDGTLITDENGLFSYVASSDAYINRHNTICVNTYSK